MLTRQSWEALERWEYWKVKASTFAVLPLVILSAPVLLILFTIKVLGIKWEDWEWEIREWRRKRNEK